MCVFTCVYFYVCMYEGACMCGVYVYTCVWRPDLNLWFVPSMPSIIYFWDEVSQWDLDFSGMLSWLDRRPQEPTCFCLLNTKLTNRYHLSSSSSFFFLPFFLPLLSFLYLFLLLFNKGAELRSPGFCGKHFITWIASRLLLPSLFIFMIFSILYLNHLYFFIIKETMSSYLLRKIS